MTQEELCAALNAISENVPVAYRAFVDAQEPPFICYLFTGDGDVMADDSNYVEISGFDVELCTDKKDPSLEADVQAALRALGLTWSKDETYIDAEKLHEVIYSIQII